MSGEILRIFAVVLIASIFAVFLKENKGEIGVAFVLGTGALVVLFIINYVTPIFKNFYEIIENSNISRSVFEVPIKALGIAYITGFTADACRDFGQGALASKTEFAGKCAVFALTVPLLEAILQTALELAKK